MIQIDDKIISLDIFNTRFCCDIAACKGICCVEGNAGAPLEFDEVDILEEEYDNYKEYMTPEGIQAIKEQGFMVIDSDGDYTTPLVNDCECAYAFTENGTTLCAIERACLNGKTEFKKPISCHLYPIRVAQFSNGTYGLNYHRWNVCSAALELGSKLGTPVYKILREPLTRKFGEEFYNTLDEVAQSLEKESSK